MAYNRLDPQVHHWLIPHKLLQCGLDSIFIRVSQLLAIFFMQLGGIIEIGYHVPRKKSLLRGWFLAIYMFCRYVTGGLPSGYRQSVQRVGLIRPPGESRPESGWKNTS
jgi:hypothetical protein